MRWIVGDIHGCASELERLLRAIRFDVGRDELWSVGDLVNTGPDSVDALRLWREAGGRGVLGNHDIHTLRVRQGTRPLRPEDRLDALFAADDAAELLAALRRLPILVHLPGDERVRDVWIVHAGVHPRWTDLGEVAARINAPPHDDPWLASPWVHFATHVRCCSADGEMIKNPGPPESCPPPFEPWDRFYDGPALVVHGHWAQRGFYRNRTTMSLDSGCVYGGELSAWCQEEDRVVQVAAKAR